MEPDGRFGDLDLFGHKVSQHRQATPESRTPSSNEDVVRGPKPRMNRHVTEWRFSLRAVPSGCRVWVRGKFADRRRIPCASTVLRQLAVTVRGVSPAPCVQQMRVPDRDRLNIHRPSGLAKGDRPFLAGKRGAGRVRRGAADHGGLGGYRTMAARGQGCR